MSAGRGKDIKDWVSYLEEEFNRSGDDNDGGSGDNDDLRPEPKPARAFQTSVTSHTNAMDLLDQIDTAPPNDLTVVLFFAHYCKTCQRAIVPFKQLANDSESSVRFVRFETSSLSPKQFFSLGIDRVPFLQIYRNGICVASFSATEKTSRTSRKMVLRPRLLENIEACRRRSMTEWSAFRDKYDAEIEANKLARAKIREAGLSRKSMEHNGDNDEDNDDDDERLYRSVRTLTSESDLLRLLRDNEDSRDDNSEGRDEDSTVVIMFHSHFDSSCLRAQHKFRKIASERQQTTTPPSCTMARIEASILPDKTLQSLGIERYPHIQIYRSSRNSEKGEGTIDTKECVASFSIPRSFLFSRMLHESLDAIDQRTPEEWAEFFSQHREQIKTQQLALEGIVREKEQR
jgi:thiol-disulfide isomerase/thioredoxin